MSSRDDGARDERAEAEEQAWRDIVDHYGDQPVIPDDLLDGWSDGLSDGLADGLSEGLADGSAADLTDGQVDGFTDGPAEAPTEGATQGPAGSPGPGSQAPGPGAAREPFRFEPYADHFVPPPLPPPPDISTDRRLAWLGLVAPPVVLLIVVVLQYPLPGLITGGLVVAFLASFGYLVATMSRDPRDPDDDGARL